LVWYELSALRASLRDVEGHRPSTPPLKASCFAPFRLRIPLICNNIIDQTARFLYIKKIEYDLPARRGNVTPREKYGESGAGFWKQRCSRSSKTRLEKREKRKEKSDKEDRLEKRKIKKKKRAGMKQHRAA
jgi:hypothetical protein